MCLWGIFTHFWLLWEKVYSLDNELITDVCVHYWLDCFVGDLWHHFLIALHIIFQAGFIYKHISTLGILFWHFCTIFKTVLGSCKAYFSTYLNNVIVFNSQYFIKGLANQNRVVLNDTVAIEVLPKSKWTCPSSVVEVDENVDPEAENSLENVSNASLFYYNGIKMRLHGNVWQPK